MLATLEPEALEAEELEPVDELELEELADEEELAPPLASAAPAAPQATPGLSAQALLLPLARALRAPLRAVRTYAGLVDQRPDDASLRRELHDLVERDLGGLDETLQRVERFARFGAPVPRAFPLAALLGAELDARASAARAKTLVVLRELDAQAPPCLADESQVRFAIGALLDLAVRLVPAGGDLYLGSAYHAKRDERPPGHRILLRFHSPEDVLAGPLDDADGGFLEVVLARNLFERAGASFALDASGAQDNLVLIELPG
jgi:signal transduction histidine kinase